MRRRCLVLASLLAWVSVAGVSQSIADEPVVTLQSTVTGSREQPRVMYIVPWQSPEAAELDYTLDNRLVQEVFAPIDRDEFIREIQLRGELSGDSQATAITNP